MDQDKKQELAETDKRWNFEKTVKTPVETDWEEVKDEFNQLQGDQGDLYMTISNLELPTAVDKLRQWYRNKTGFGEHEVTFHHSQVYNFYFKLAYELEICVGEAVKMLLKSKEELRDHFELGETVNVSINNVDSMDTSESSVTRDELQELLEDG
jgi:hypothetical protein